MVTVQRFDVAIVTLDPTRGAALQKARPCVIVSPDELNRVLQTVIIAPMTTRGNAYPWRVPVTFGGQQGHIALDQIRAVDAARLTRVVGQLDQPTADQVLTTLAMIFAP